MVLGFEAQSENARMIYVRRELWTSPGPSPQLKQCQILKYIWLLRACPVAF